MRARDVISAVAEQVKLKAFACERCLLTEEHVDLTDLKMDLDKIKYILRSLCWDMDPAVETDVEVPDEWK